MTKIFLDTEFIENGKTIELVSIGLVKENGDYTMRELASKFGVGITAIHNIVNRKTWTHI